MRIHKLLTIPISLLYLVQLILSPNVRAEGISSIPVPLISASDVYRPMLMMGVKLDQQDPLLFNFVMVPGDETFDPRALKTESNRLIKYFLATLTIPKEDLWVNLSPLEPDRIIPEIFGKTEMGKDLLAQDYLLKKITSSMTFPDSETGQEFWSRVYAALYERFGTVDLPANALNKIWIVPSKARIYEQKDGAFILESHLKVMLEEDYLAIESQVRPARKTASFRPDQNSSNKEDAVVYAVTAEMLREIVVPEIEKEVNQGEAFKDLRKIYHSMILATWYKSKLKDSILKRMYLEKNKIEGIHLSDPDEKDKIYQQYLSAFQNGMYDLVREEFDPATQEVLQRQYFSGGTAFHRLDEFLMTSSDRSAAASVAEQLEGAYSEKTLFSPVGRFGDVFMQSNLNSAQTRHLLHRNHVGNFIFE
ncbi:MAG: hypothetical protein KC713_09315 [Candidatus Omnitrophica bacterium]|nr:hypothetical protein [Candidatus Omnitrophota bacterium]